MRNLAKSLRAQGKDELCDYILLKIAKETEANEILADLSYSFIMRNLRKSNEEKAKEFQIAYKKAFDEGYESGVKDFDKVALFAAIKECGLEREELNKVASFNKKAAGQTFEQTQMAYQNAGGDTLNAGKGQYGKSDTSKAQYEAILNAGNYLPDGSDNLAIEIRSAIQNGRVVGVTVLTNPANPNMARLIDARVRGLTFPVNPKMDFVITRF